MRCWFVENFLDKRQNLDENFVENFAVNFGKGDWSVVFDMVLG